VSIDNNSIIEAPLNSSVLQPVTEEMHELGFELESVSEAQAIYRDEDRYVTFTEEEGAITLRLGVGSLDAAQQSINSMRLDDMVRFMFGGLQRGKNRLEKTNLSECLKSSMKDLREFAHEFLHGDFRPFLRTLALKHREDKGTLREA
jgi:hypothetical protein